MRGKAALIKYNWIEKTITATVVTIGYISGDVPARLMFLIVITNWLFIPVILSLDVRLRRNLHARAGLPQNGPRPAPGTASSGAAPD